MRKRILTLFITAVLSVSLAACANNENASDAAKSISEAGTKVVDYTKSTSSKSENIKSVVDQIRSVAKAAENYANSVNDKE